MRLLPWKEVKRVNDSLWVRQTGIHISSTIAMIVKEYCWKVFISLNDEPSVGYAASLDQAMKDADEQLIVLGYKLTDQKMLVMT